MNNFLAFTTGFLLGVTVCAGLMSDDLNKLKEMEVKEKLLKELKCENEGA